MPVQGEVTAAAGVNVEAWHGVPVQSEVTAAAGVNVEAWSVSAGRSDGSSRSEGGGMGCQCRVK